MYQCFLLSKWLRCARAGNKMKLVVSREPAPACFRINVDGLMVDCVFTGIQSYCRALCLYTPCCKVLGISNTILVLQKTMPDLEKSGDIWRLCSSLSPYLRYTARPATIPWSCLGFCHFWDPDWIRRCMLGKSKPGSRGKQGHFQPYKAWKHKDHGNSSGHVRVWVQRPLQNSTKTQYVTSHSQYCQNCTIIEPRVQPPAVLIAYQWFLPEPHGCENAGAIGLWCPPHQSLGKGQNFWQLVSNLFLRLPASKGSRNASTTAGKYLTQMIAGPTNLNIVNA